MVLERWITPSLFEGLEARDEYSFCEELGERAADALDNHRKTFITEEDIKWLKHQGVNALRVPVPHWVFGNFPPFTSGANYLDWIMDVALAEKIDVLIDLHTAPGSQNGNDHSGRTGDINWHTEAGNITRTLDVVEELAQRYCKYPNLLGIALLNEPSGTIPQDTLLEYYRLGYARVRHYCDDTVAVVISDTFNPEEWKNVMTSPEYKNVWLDTHMYQVFSSEDKKRNIHKILQKAKNDWKYLLVDIQNTRPVIVGEWSLGLDSKAFRGLDPYEKDKAHQAYSTAQLEAFYEAKGHFFWTYKTETMRGWSFRDAVQKGWLNYKIDNPA